MTVRIIKGDVREKLAELPADYFDCIVTSPPYYGLRRDYGMATWEGGDPVCKHVDQSYGKVRGNGVWFDGGKPRELDGGRPFKGQCPCGARRIDAQIGLEPTIDAYLETMVSVCRELRRVLKPSGVFFLNIGDSYAGSSKTGEARVGNDSGNGSSFHGGKCKARNRNGIGFISGLKPKDLCLVPERLGIALQGDGWWVRSKIVWHKINPMPESVQGSHFSRHMITIEDYERLSGLPYTSQFKEEQPTDPDSLVPCPGCDKCNQHNGYILHMSAGRPTSAHETIWMLTKSARYFWDAEAVKEKCSEGTHGGNWTEGGSKQSSLGQQIGGRLGNSGDDGSRNVRNVWSFSSQPYPGAHFATFPPELAKRCIKAGSSERGCCPACGAPWVRILNKRDGEAPANTIELQASGLPTHRKLGSQYTKWMNENLVKTIGWQPSCKCSDAVPIPARILDPFAGAGTALLVADRLGRDSVGIELNADYVAMCRARIYDDCPMFSDVEAAE